VSLIARHLEAGGIATEVVGSAQDIVETVGVPRFVFVDYPLGNPFGKPDLETEQASVLDAALALVSSASGPRTTRRLDLVWGCDEWRDNYMHVGPDNAAELAEAGRLRREKQRSPLKTQNSG
jgi:D-proline reductase (dithiol) PrdB